MTNEEYLKIIGADPTNVLKADDGDYDYQPISHIKNELDDVFGGRWGFDLDRETIGKIEAIAKGTLWFEHPVSGLVIYRSGTAAIVLGKGLRLDYPKLESAVLASAAKKIGKRFGRDLNRDKDDVPVIEVSGGGDEEIDEEYKRVVEQLNSIVYKEAAEMFLSMSSFRLNPKLKKLVNDKPSKP